MRTTVISKEWCSMVSRMVMEDWFTLMEYITKETSRMTHLKARVPSSTEKGGLLMSVTGLTTNFMESAPYTINFQLLCHPTSILEISIHLEIAG